LSGSTRTVSTAIAAPHKLFLCAWLAPQAGGLRPEVMHSGCHCWLAQQCFVRCHKPAGTHSMSGNSERFSGLTPVAFSSVLLTAGPASSGTHDATHVLNQMRHLCPDCTLHPSYPQPTASSLTLCPAERSDLCIICKSNARLARCPIVNHGCDLQRRNIFWARIGLLAHKCPASESADSGRLRPCSAWVGEIYLSVGSSRVERYNAGIKSTAALPIARIGNS
jgi:hypothetical protein